MFITALFELIITIAKLITGNTCKSEIIVPYLPN